MSTQLPTILNNEQNTIQEIVLPSQSHGQCKKLCNILNFNLDTLNIILLLIIITLSIYTIKNRFF